jgi:hypothetical protein
LLNNSIVGSRHMSEWTSQRVEQRGEITAQSARRNA